VCETKDGIRIGYRTYCPRTHNSELHVITALSLISTIYSTPTATAKPFPGCCVLTSHSLATASNNGEFSVFRAQTLPSPTLVQNFLPAMFSTELDHHLFSVSLAELNCTQHSTIFLNYLRLPILNWLSVGLGSLLYSLGRTQQKTPFPKTVSPLLLAYSLPRERVYPTVA
jgi:hypothetical protein